MHFVPRMSIYIAHVQFFKLSMETVVLFFDITIYDIPKMCYL